MMEEKKLQAIVEDLKNPRPFIRNKAIEELMAINDKSVVPVLFKMVSDETDFVKVQFCRFLGKIKGDSAIPPLVIFLIEKSDSVAREAAEALEKIENEKKNNALILLLHRRVSHFSRAFAIKSLGRQGVNRALPQLVELLSSQEEDIKELAIEALRQIGDPAAIRPLLRLLGEDNERVIYITLLTLGEIGELRISENILPFLGHKNENIRRAAIWALSKLNCKKAVPKFKLMLESDPSEIVREEIAKRLGKLIGQEAVKPLIFSEAFDKSHNVRVYAGWAIKDIAVKQREAVLLKFARAKDEALRAEVFLEIGHTGNPKFFRMLKKALKKDKSELVRAAAAQGLSFIQAKGVKDVLKEALSDNQRVAHAAADSLLRCASTEDREIGSGMSKGEFNEDPYIKSVGEKIIEKISNSKADYED